MLWAAAGVQLAPPVSVCLYQAVSALLPCVRACSSRGSHSGHQHQVQQGAPRSYSSITAAAANHQAARTRNSTLDASGDAASSHNAGLAAQQQASLGSIAVPLTAAATCQLPSPASTMHSMLVHSMLSTSRRSMHSTPGRSRPAPAAFQTQQQLAEALQQQGQLSQRCLNALAAVDRKHYVHAYKGIPDEVAYMDTAVAAGCGQVLPPPSVCAQMLAALEPWVVPGARLLDVGSGTGYMTALLAVLAGPGGAVLGLDKQAKLVEQSRTNLAASNLGLVLLGEGAEAGPAAAAASSQPLGPCQVQVLVDNVMADDSCLLEGALAPFHAIHLGAALTDLQQLPRWLPRLLRPGGRLVAPYGEPHRHQVLIALERGPSGELGPPQQLGGLACRFGPLTQYYDDHVQR